jgi:hypothetical protein
MNLDRFFSRGRILRFRSFSSILGQVDNIAVWDSEDYFGPHPGSGTPADSWPVILSALLKEYRLLGLYFRTGFVNLSSVFWAQKLKK